MVSLIPSQTEKFQDQIQEQLKNIVDENLRNKLENLLKTLEEDSPAIISGNLYRMLLNKRYLTIKNFKETDGGFIPFKLPEQKMLALLAIRKGLQKFPSRWF